MIRLERLKSKIRETKEKKKRLEEALDSVHPIHYVLSYADYMSDELKWYRYMKRLERYENKLLKLTV